MNEEGINIPEGDYISLTQAALIAGYSIPKGGSGNLRKAAQEGKLRTIKPNARIRLTTVEWLNEYLASLKHDKGGRPRKRPAPDAETQPSEGDTPKGIDTSGQPSVPIPLSHRVKLAERERVSSTVSTNSAHAGV